MNFKLNLPNKQESPTAPEKEKPNTGFKLNLAGDTPDSDKIGPAKLHPRKFATCINKQTLEPKEISVPDEKETPRMAAIKKLGCGETTTSCQAGESTTPSQLKNPFAGLGMSKAKPKPQTPQKKPLNPFAGDNVPKKKEPSLWGTGLTKKVLSQTGKQQDKDLFGKKGKQVDIEIIPADVVDEDVANLPTDLMDDSIELDEYQQTAVDGMRNEMYSVLIGAAGTGKTTALKFLLRDLEDGMANLKQTDLPTYKETQRKIEGYLPAICFCSFTGKAVQQMKRALPAKYHPLANTIHATLGYAPVEEEVMDEVTNEWRIRKVFRPSYDASRKLPFKVIVIDESGTVPVSLWHELLAAKTDDCRVLMLGDLNQLPPVAGHSILGFAMLHWPTFTLEKLHRQAKGDPIAENAHRILQGRKPLTHKESMRFVVKKIADGSKGARQELLATIRHLHKQDVFNPTTDALIVPQNIDGLGQEELNNTLVNYFNPTRKDENGNFINRRHIIKAGYAHVAFAVGDKVMLTKNDTTRGLTNGMVGVVTSIVNNAAFSGEAAAANAEISLGTIDLADMNFDDVEVEDETDTPESERAASHIMTVKLQNVEEPVEFSTAGQFKNVILAYAMTCHKSQGSEYRNVVVLCHSANRRMLSREWLYTAVTRAKERVILLCNDRGLTVAVNTQRIKGDTIAEKAKKFLALQGNKSREKVNLPKARKIAKLNMTHEIPKEK